MTDRTDRAIICVGYRGRDGRMAKDRHFYSARLGLRGEGGLGMCYECFYEHKDLYEQEQEELRKDGIKINDLERALREGL